MSATPITPRPSLLVSEAAFFCLSNAFNDSFHDTTLSKNRVRIIEDSAS